MHAEAVRYDAMPSKGGLLHDESRPVKCGECNVKCYLHYDPGVPWIAPQRNGPYLSASVLAALEGRQLVFVLFVLAANKLLLQKTLGKVPASYTECDCEAEHEGSKCNSK